MRSYTAHDFIFDYHVLEQFILTYFVRNISIFSDYSMLLLTRTGSGLSLNEEDLSALLGVNTEEWSAEALSIRAHYARFDDRLPPALRRQLQGLVRRLGMSV